MNAMALSPYGRTSRFRVNDSFVPKRLADAAQFTAIKLNGHLHHQAATSALIETVSTELRVEVLIRRSYWLSLTGDTTAVRARLYRPAAAPRLRCDRATHDEAHYPTLALEANPRRGNRECLTYDMGRFPAGNRGDSYPRTCGNGRGRKRVHERIRRAGSRGCDQPQRASCLRARFWYRPQAYRRKGDAHPSLSNCKRQQADYFRSDFFVAGAGQAHARRQGVRFGRYSGIRLPHPFHEICQ